VEAGVSPARRAQRRFRRRYRFPSETAATILLPMTSPDYSAAGVPVRVTVLDEAGALGCTLNCGAISADGAARDQMVHTLRAMSSVARWTLKMASSFE
jgi:hypothetical protein